MVPKYYIPLMIIVEAEDAAAAYASVWDRLEDEYDTDENGDTVHTRGSITLYEEDVDSVATAGWMEGIVRVIPESEVTAIKEQYWDCRLGIRDAAPVPDHKADHTEDPGLTRAHAEFMAMLEDPTMFQENDE